MTEAFNSRLPFWEFKKWQVEEMKKFLSFLQSKNASGSRHKKKKNLPLKVREDTEMKKKERDC